MRPWLPALLVFAACGEGPDVSPAAGRVAGGDAVRLVGEDFVGHGPPVVFLGQRAAKGVVIESDRVLRLITPEGEAVGPVDIRVEFFDGTTREFPQAFRYEEQGAVLRLGERR
ncbi:MAG: IPT/TIG domain-containing protein [Nannocystaceae bacterium]